MLKDVRRLLRGHPEEPFSCATRRYLAGGLGKPRDIASLCRLAECAEDMQNFSIKQEAIRRALHNRDEEDAYLRAIIHLVGERNTQAPWNMDGEL